jgi:hypothetical protein
VILFGITLLSSDGSRQTESDGSHGTRRCFRERDEGIDELNEGSRARARSEAARSTADSACSACGTCSARCTCTRGTKATRGTSNAVNACGTDGSETYRSGRSSYWERHDV